MIMSCNKKLPCVHTQTHTQSHTLYPSRRPLHFLLVPIMQEQAALLPGSQAGEEGTAVWSHGAHRFPLTSAPPCLPPFFTHLSLFQFFSLFLHLSYVIDLFPLLLLTFVFLRLPHGPTQIRTVENKKSQLTTSSQEKAHAQTNTLRFSRWKQDVPPDRKDIFTCH